MASGTENTPPFTPRYARATAASNAKCTPKSPATRQEPNRSRLSLSVYKHRSSSLSIRPVDPKKQCPLAILPAEIRLLIYNYALPQDMIHVINSPKPRFVMPARGRWPPILHICRFIRKEAAHEFYTKNSFQSHITGFQHGLTGWIAQLSKTNFDSLAQNRRMLVMVPTTVWYSVSPWQLSKDFGNIYNIPGEGCRTHFLEFCRLAKWWLQCARNAERDVNWCYQIMPSTSQLSEYDRRIPLKAVRFWLFENMSTILKPCVQKNWTRTRHTNLMKKPAMGMLDSVDRQYKAILSFAIRCLPNAISSDTKRAEAESELIRQVQEWDMRVDLLRHHLQTW